MEIDVDAYLEHHGVKGMRWGVRRQRRANLLNKVGKGKGTTTEKLRAGLSVSPLDLARGKGFKGAARVRGLRQTNRNARVAKGEASVKDKLAFYGGTRYQDIFPTKKSSTNTKAAVATTIAAVVTIKLGSNFVKAALRAA